MRSPAELGDLVVERLVFETWSIEIPLHFAEDFVEDGSYWHAWDACRSVSLTSLLLTDGGSPVPAELIARELPGEFGAPVEDRPDGLVGWCGIGPAVQPARASRALSGFVAVDGRVLIVTITSDDVEWARTVWRSIRSWPAWPIVPRPSDAASARPN
jgi:hypothetical protein